MVAHKYLSLATIILISLLLTGTSCDPDYKTLYKNLEVKGNNITEAYNKLSPVIDSFFDKKINIGKKTINTIRDFNIILVPGFLSDLPDQMGIYFGDQIKWFKKMKFDHMVASIESEQSPNFNGKIISQVIKVSEKPVIIITHSKGGIDTLEALRLAPEIHSKVKAWITIQTPFYGSPIADCFWYYVSFRDTYSWILKALGGTQKSLKCLTYGDRKDYNTKFKTEILKIVKTIPFISFTSWQKNKWIWEGQTPLIEPFRDFMARKIGLRNDGLVPLKTAYLPNSDYIVVPNVDHMVSVINNPIFPYDRVHMTKILLVMALDKILNPKEQEAKEKN
jgi:hypothetical protein